MRIEQLTFTRFVAALAIVIYHYGSGSYLFNGDDYYFIFRQANLGVSYFFTLSGFVMIIAYGSRGPVNFFEYLKNRMARIYPVYLLALFWLLCIDKFNFDPVDLFLNVIMIQSWFPGKAMTLNFPGWSLSVELFFYSVFPLLLNAVYSKLKWQINALWIIVFWIVSQIVVHRVSQGTLGIPGFSVSDLSYHPILHLNEFLVGNITGLLFLNKLKSYNRNYLPAIVGLFVLLIIALKFSHGYNLHNGLLCVIFAPLILLMTLSNDKITHFFSRKPFVFLGEISFGVYILQFPVWKFFADHKMELYLGLDPRLDFTRSFLIRLMILLVLATISYLFFEKPLRTRIQKLRMRGYLKYHRAATP